MSDPKSNGRVDSDGIWWIHESDLTWRRILEDDEECWTNATDATLFVSVTSTVEGLGIEGFSQSQVIRLLPPRAAYGDWIRLPPLAVMVFAQNGERPTHVEGAHHD